MFAAGARKIWRVVMTRVDLTKPTGWSAVALLGSPLFIGGYLLTVVAIPPQTVHAQIVEPVERATRVAIQLCDDLPVDTFCCGKLDRC